MRLILCRWSTLITILLAAAAFSACTSSAPAPAEPARRTELPQAEVQRLTAYFERMRGARYMEKNPQPVRGFPGWQNFPLIKCRYSVSDPVDGRRKTAEVIMLNAEPEKLARWVVRACIEAKGSARPADLDRLSHHIIGASGAQFPVAGIVFEAMDDAPRQKVYCFRDGVTVRLEGVRHTTTEQPTEAEIKAAIDPGTRIENVFEFARIQSTTRAEYRAAGGTENVSGEAWLGVVRKLYQQAWNSDRNELMIAWAKANL
jgi:hypothetical protein